MNKFVILVGLLSVAACSTSNDKGEEPVEQISQALPGPSPIHVSAQFTVGESSNTHLVTFPKLFSLDETEITVDQYGDCVTDGACTTPGIDTDCNWGVMGRDSHPVNCVTLYQAANYCAWAGKRLPTAEEWEFGARYNDPAGRIYPWGDSSSGYATKTNTNSGDAYSTTAPVGTFPDSNSALGLKDMSGNVWEWTQSKSCGDDEACTNCPSGETCANACDSCGTTDHLIKGGGYGHAVSYSRSAYFTYQAPETSNPTTGFRCALTE